MTPRQLHAFVAVAQTLSFARAGERLHMSQPALSLAIKSLEQGLGGRLLSRTTREVRLTPEGAALLPQAQQLLADWEAVRDRSRQHFSLKRGHVVIAVMPSLAATVLPRMLSRFRQRFPHIEVSINDVVHEEVVRLVEEGRVELGFAFEPEAAGARHFEPLFVDRFIAIVPPTSVRAGQQFVTWAQLLEHEFIALQRPSTVRHMLEESLAQARLSLRVSLDCHQLVTVGQCVAAGLGVSVVPQYCREQMTALGAVCVRLERPAIRRTLGLITRGEASLSSAADAMRQTILHEIGIRK